MRSARLTVILVAHGSRDPRAGRATYALARAVGAGWDVRAAFLDHAGPRPLDVLATLRPGRRAILVPLLLTDAYHGRVDVPAVLDAARDLPISVSSAAVLGAGSPAALQDALLSRLAAACTGVSDSAAAVVAEHLDAVVLVAAGTRSASARAGIVTVADALAERLGLPCAVAYASASPPAAGEAVARLRAAGARRVGVASYFLAPGLLHDAAIDSARSAGATIAAAPLTDHADLVRLIRSRVHDTLTTRVPAAA